MAKRTVKDLKDLKGKTVFVRVDYNVPVKDGVIGDDTRIRASLPTLKYLIAADARVVLASHLGRPKKGPAPEFSLAPVAKRLSDLLGKPVGMAPDCVGESVRALASALHDGDVLLLENVRFHPEEEKNDPAFAQQLISSSGASVFVNDAFGTAHRAHASTEGVSKHVPVSVAGFLMETELRYLGLALHAPEHPFVAVLGGAKVSDKIQVIESLLPRVDALLIGGGMAYTFFRAQGLPTAKSLVEQDKLDLARDTHLARRGNSGWLDGARRGPADRGGVRRAGQGREARAVERSDGRVRDEAVCGGHPGRGACAGRV
jgi:phosphoglycerate kinase